jgi:hypothetical protein
MTVLGKDIESGELVSIDYDARSRGIYVIGSTGTGKTTFLQSVAYQDMKAGHGVCVLDPHGDMIDWLLERIPEKRVGDVILFDPSDIEYPFAINLLECDRKNSQEVRWTISNILGSFKHMFANNWGPRLEHVFNHALWTAMTIEESTLLEVLLLLTNKPYKDKHTADLEEPLLKDFWAGFPDDIKTKRHFELVGSTVNKLTPFLLDHQMRNIVGQTKNTINLREIMDNQKILLVNLSKGELGENNSSLLGSFIINQILIAALSRRDLPYEKRHELPFHVIVDEYQNFSGESFSVLQSEARKYAVDLVVAHQFREQLTDENRGSALNVGNFVFFRSIGTDGRDLAGQFDNTPPPPDDVWEPIRTPSEQWEGYYKRGLIDHPVPGKSRAYSDVFMQTANDLANLPPFQAKAKIISWNDKSKRPILNEYDLDNLNPGEDEFIKPYYGIPNQSNVEKIREQSRKLTKPRKEVDAEITARTFGVADENIRRETHEDLPQKK